MQLIILLTIIDNGGVKFDLLMTFIVSVQKIIT